MGIYRRNNEWCRRTRMAGDRERPTVKIRISERGLKENINNEKKKLNSLWKRIDPKANGGVSLKRRTCTTLNRSCCDFSKPLGIFFIEMWKKINSSLLTNRRDSLPIETLVFVTRLTISILNAVHGEFRHSPVMPNRVTD